MNDEKKLACARAEYAERLRRLRCAMAKKRLWIMTPYFLPGFDVVGALVGARLRGVDVKILLPERTNVHLAHWAAQHNLKLILARELPVYSLPAPFIHTKAILIDDDYAVLRKFRGKSLLKTYLSTVIANLFRDHLIRKHGKWRPSAMARRRGREAAQLERLLFRDGLSVTEAVEILKRNAGVEQSREELTTLAAELPVRLRSRCRQTSAAKRFAASSLAALPVP